MSEALAAAGSAFLAPANLTEVQLATQLGIMLGGYRLPDLYFQHAEQQAFVLEDGRVRDASFSIDHGVGRAPWPGPKRLCLCQRYRCGVAQGGGQRR